MNKYYDSEFYEKKYDNLYYIKKKKFFQNFYKNYDFFYYDTLKNKKGDYINEKKY